MLLFDNIYIYIYIFTCRAGVATVRLYANYSPANVVRGTQVDIGRTWIALGLDFFAGFGGTRIGLIVGVGGTPSGGIPTSRISFGRACPSL